MMGNDNHRDALGVPCQQSIDVGEIQIIAKRRLNQFARDGPERRGGNRNLEHHSVEAVDQPGADVSRAGMVLGVIDAINQVILAFIQLVDQSGNAFRFLLQIVVDCDHDVAAGMRKAAHDCVVLAKVPHQLDGDNITSLVGNLLNRLP